MIKKTIRLTREEKLDRLQKITRRIANVQQFFNVVYLSELPDLQSFEKMNDLGKDERALAGFLIFLDNKERAYPDPSDFLAKEDFNAFCEFLLEMFVKHSNKLVSLVTKIALLNTMKNLDELKRKIDDRNDSRKKVKKDNGDT